MGRDHVPTAKCTHLSRFQSTRPVWGATSPKPRRPQQQQFQSTRPVWGATKFAGKSALKIDISIHAPRVGRDGNIVITCAAVITFQSTRPVWGATRRRRSWWSAALYFNPRAPCGARPVVSAPIVSGILFQSTRPVWGATKETHGAKLAAYHFNPRAPCGARLPPFAATINSSTFQSTRPVWGATLLQETILSRELFQSTRPVWGATFKSAGKRLFHCDFNPRAPCGARPLSSVDNFLQVLISIHAPRVGRDPKM